MCHVSEKKEEMSYRIDTVIETRDPLIANLMMLTNWSRKNTLSNKRRNWSLVRSLEVFSLGNLDTNLGFFFTNFEDFLYPATATRSFGFELHIFRTIKPALQKKD